MQQHQRHGCTVVSTFMSDVRRSPLGYDCKVNGQCLILRHTHRRPEEVPAASAYHGNCH